MKEFSLNKLGQRIKVARKAKNKTQDEVAHAIGVNPVSMIEECEQETELSRLLKTSKTTKNENRISNKDHP